MRFPANSDQADLVLGKRFQPGKGDNLFCKPTDVVVLSTGEFFISDGYGSSGFLFYVIFLYQLTNRIPSNFLLRQSFDFALQVL